MYFPKFICRYALPAYRMLATRSSQEEEREQRVVTRPSKGDVLYYPETQATEGVSEG